MMSEDDLYNKEIDRIMKKVAKDKQFEIGLNEAMDRIANSIQSGKSFAESLTPGECVVAMTIAAKILGVSPHEVAEKSDSFEEYMKNLDLSSPERLNAMGLFAEVDSFVKSQIETNEDEVDSEES